MPSRLEHTTLGDLLGQLYRERLTGALELVDDRGAVHRLELQAGEVSMVQSPCGPRLGELLVARLGTKLHPYVERQLWRANGTRLGEALIAAGVLTHDTLNAVLKQQTRLRLEALFQLQSARVVFRPTRSLPEQAKLHVDDYLAGRSRKRGTGSATRFATSQHADADAWALLGLAPGASVAAVRTAYRRRALALHPDTNQQRTARDRAATTAEFLRLSAAYRKLVA